MVKDTYSHEDIQFNAYLRWEQSGKPWGRELEFWFQAENFLKEITDVLKKISDIELELLEKQRQAYENYSEQAGTLVHDATLVIPGPAKEKPKKNVCDNCGCGLPTRFNFWTWLHDLFVGRKDDTKDHDSETKKN